MSPKPPKIATIDPILYIFGSSSHPNSVRSTKILYKQLHPTSPSQPRKHASEVLALYRDMQRYAARTMDPVFRHFLRQHIWESFLANAHEPSDELVRGLLARSYPHLSTLKAAATISGLRKKTKKYFTTKLSKPRTRANGEDPKAVNQVYDYCVTRINIEEGPLCAALGGISRLTVQSYPKGTAAAHTLRTLHAPPRNQVSTFREYEDALTRASLLREPKYERYFRELLALPASDPKDKPSIDIPRKFKHWSMPHAYFRFLAAYKPAQTRLPSQARISSGASTNPLPEGTVSGANLPLVREHTIVRKTIKNVLHSVITAPGASPIDPRVMRYLVHSQLASLGKCEWSQWTAVTEASPIYKLDITSDKKVKENSEKDAQVLQTDSTLLPCVAPALPGSSPEEKFVWDKSKVILSPMKHIRFYKRRILDVMEKSYTIIEDDFGNFQLILPPPARIRYSKRA